MNDVLFKKMQPDQLPMLKQWFAMPHIKHWWSLSEEAIEEDYLDEYIYSYIIYYKDQPIGFVRYYYANKMGEEWWPDEKEDSTVGIDQFISDEAMLGKGIGSHILRQFVDMIFNNPLHKKIILDVHPDNTRAIRCYEKIGFNYKKQLMTPNGIANQMELLSNR